MGIQGLLPFLKKIHKPVNIAEFEGCTVAIDAYCWLHKGAFSCAEKLALGEKTDQYVYYCMKYIDYMLKNNIKPILVFDGCHLKSKADVEKSRREKRELHRKKAAQFLREGRRGEAKECLQRCVDITPQMALELMNVCRDRGVDCIVAPYEADAQLAYLNLKGIAQIIITEDSDLLLFGCDKVVFKMDFYGNGTLIEKARLNEVLSMQGGCYTFEKFRHMCILSGCDYLSSLPGIGLAKACKVFKTARQPDIALVLKKLPSYLKMNLTVTPEYIQGFIKAENTFLYQLVFDPISRTLCPLNPYPPEIKVTELDYAGEYLPEEKAYQIALGNIDIHNHQCIAFFDPDRFEPKHAAKPKYRYQLSIWDRNYRIKGGSPCKQIQDVPRPSLHDKEQTVKVKILKKTPVKRHREISIAPDQKTDEELVSLYKNAEEETTPAAKRVKIALFSEKDELSQQENQENTTLPVKTMSPTKSSSGQLLEQRSRHGDPDQDIEPAVVNKTRTHAQEAASRKSAANIGDDAFRTNSAVVTEINPALTPTKNRNVFAVSSSCEKQPKFNLNTPAVEVKSRFFHSKNLTSKTRSPAKRKLSPSTRSSPANKQDKKSEAHNPIRVMFEKSKAAKTAHHTSDEGPITQQSTAAKDSFKQLKENSTTVIKQELCDDELSPQVTSPKVSQNSVFQKFQSSFLNKKSDQKSSPTSVFSWSKAKLTRNKDTQLLSTQNCDDKHKSLLTAANNVHLPADTKSVSELPKPKSLSSFFSSSSYQVKNKQFYSTQNMGVKSEIEHCNDDESNTDDVTELKSYSYDAFLKTLDKDDDVEGSSTQSTHTKKVDSQSSKMDSNDITSALMEASQRSPQDVLNTSSSSLGDDMRLASEKSNLQSFDSGCFSQEVIDLSDNEIDSSSQNLTLSGSSKNLGKPSCRVSGLSRGKKNKPSTKPAKRSSGVTGQRSIMDLMSQFQYNRVAAINNSQE